MHDCLFHDTYHFFDFILPNLKIIIKPTTPDTGNTIARIMLNNIPGLSPISVPGGILKDLEYLVEALDVERIHKKELQN